MQDNLPVDRLVRKALRAGETIGRPGIRQPGVPQGAKRLEELGAEELGNDKLKTMLKIKTVD